MSSLSAECSFRAVVKSRKLNRAWLLAVLNRADPSFPVPKLYGMAIHRESLCGLNGRDVIRQFQPNGVFEAAVAINDVGSVPGHDGHNLQYTWSGPVAAKCHLDPRSLRLALPRLVPKLRYRRSPFHTSGTGEASAPVGATAALAFFNDDRRDGIDLTLLRSAFAILTRDLPAECNSSSRLSSSGVQRLVLFFGTASHSTKRNAFRLFMRSSARTRSSLSSTSNSRSTVRTGSR